MVFFLENHELNGVIPGKPSTKWRYSSKTINYMVLFLENHQLYGVLPGKNHQLHGVISGKAVFTLILFKRVALLTHVRTIFLVASQISRRISTTTFIVSHTRGARRRKRDWTGSSPAPLRLGTAPSPQHSHLC